MSIEKIEEFAESGEKHLNNLDVKQGFQQAEKPERQWFNYLLNDFSKKINQVIDGLSDIDFEFDGFAPKISELESNYTEISSELTRVSDDFKSADAVLQGQIDGIGGGKFAYTTYAKMEAAAALPDEDPLKLPANSSIDVTNDTDPLKNGTYSYDGAVFAKSIYDVEAIVRTKVLNTFKTKSLMDASALPDGADAQVTDDTTTENNGLYIKKLGSWVKSRYSIEGLVEVMISPNIAKKPVKNLFDKTKIYSNRYISAGGGFTNLTGWTMSGFIPIKGGETYTVSGTDRRVGLVFYETEDLYAPIASSYETIKSTVIAPVNANYLIINIDTATVKAINVQVEQGSVATAYEPYALSFQVDKQGLPNDVVYKSDLDSALSSKKDYEVLAPSRNLFDESAIRKSAGLLSTNGQLSASLTNWGCSADIPVVAGTTYTLSGTRARSGLTFFSDTYNDVILYVPSADMPLTVTAPEGATKVVFNLYTSAEVGSFSNIQFEKGSRATAYEQFGSLLKVKENYVYSETPLVESKGVAVVVGLNGLTTVDGKDSQNNSFKYVLTHSPKTATPSSDIADVFNFKNFYLNNEMLCSSNDDIAPLRMGGYTVGANHGYSKYVITAAHGKTAADIGSVWTDGAVEWVLIEIKDANTLTVTARIDNTVLAANNLTHVVGAINTTAINTTTKALAQWYALTKNKRLVIKADGVTLNIGDSYNYSDKLEFFESYDIMAKNDMVEWVIANKGVAHSVIGAAVSALYANSYVFDKDGGCTIYTSVTAYKDIVLQDYMGIQAVPMPVSTQSFYVPKSTTVTTTKGTFNFALKEPMPVGRLEGRSIYFNPSTNEVDANPVDRLLMFGTNAGFAMGYLPVYDAEPSERQIKASNQYMEIRGNTQKVYPALINSADITMLNAGDSYGGVAYRKYFKLSASRTARYRVQTRNADYLYLDWHGATTDNISLDADLVGRDFVTHEKSSNVTLLSKIANNSILVKVDSTKPYGYLVLMFDK